MEIFNVFRKKIRNLYKESRSPVPLEYLRGALISYKNYVKILVLGRVFLDGSAFETPADAWWEFRSRQCADPRDMVYALRNLTKRRHILPQLAVAYEKSIEQVYMDATLEDIVVTQRLDCFRPGGPSLASYIAESRLNLPSWAVDYRSQDVELDLSGAFIWNLCSASGDLPCSFTEKDYMSLADDHSLPLQGIFIDKLSKTYLPMCRAGHNSEQSLWEAYMSMIRQALSDLGEANVTSTSSSKTIEAIVRTLMIGERNLTAASSSGPTMRNHHFALIEEGLLRLSEPFEEQIDPEYFEDRTKGRKFKWATTRHMVLSKCSLTERECFSISTTGRMSMVPEQANAGDAVCILYGASMPVVLRPVPGDEGKWWKIGPCYTHGLMDGEALQLRDEGKAEEMIFTLI